VLASISDATAPDLKRNSAGLHAMLPDQLRHPFPDGVHEFLK
jgi:hypothetical protein